MESECSSLKITHPAVACATKRIKKDKKCEFKEHKMENSLENYLELVQ